MLLKEEKTSNCMLLRKRIGWLETEGRRHFYFICPRIFKISFYVHVLQLNIHLNNINVYIKNKSRFYEVSWRKRLFSPAFTIKIEGKLFFLFCSFWWLGWALLGHPITPEPANGIQGNSQDLAKDPNERF